MINERAIIQRMDGQLISTIIASSSLVNARQLLSRYTNTVV